MSDPYAGPDRVDPTRPASDDATPQTPVAGSGTPGRQPQTPLAGARPPAPAAGAFPAAAAQPPYGASPYAAVQPPYGASPYATAHPPYGQAGPEPYGPHGQNVYGYPTPDAPVALQQGRAASAPSPLLGRIGLAVVLLSAVVSIITGWIIGVGYGQLFVDLATAGRITPDSQLDAQTLQQDPLFQQFVANNTTPITVLSGAFWTGVAGWILSIVAVARRAGRRSGIWGIVLGVLTPIALIAAMVLAALPAVRTLI